MFENSIYKKIKIVIDYIEENITEKLSLDDISEYADISKFYLHKIFKYMTGEKLMDYVRHRKLTCSLNELLYSDLKIIDIANQYHFEYEQSYTRSFKQAFNITPFKYRKDKPTLELKEKAKLEYLVPIGDNGIIFEPWIEQKPGFHVIGIPSLLCFSETINYEDAFKARSNFFNSLYEIKNGINRDCILALVFLHPTKPDYKYYVPCIEVENLDSVPVGMQGYRIAANNYVAFRHIRNNPQENVTSDIKAINDYLDLWLCESPYERILGECFFEMSDISVAASDYGEYKVFVPINKTMPSAK